MTSGMDAFAPVLLAARRMDARKWDEVGSSCELEAVGWDAVRPSEPARSETEGKCDAEVPEPALWLGADIRADAVALVLELCWRRSSRKLGSEVSGEGSMSSCAMRRLGVGCTLLSMMGAAPLLLPVVLFAATSWL